MDRQKALVIFGAAWVSAALLTWFLWWTAKSPKTEKTVACVAAAHDMPAGTRVKRTDLKLVPIPEKDLPKTAMLSINTTLDRVLLFPVSANEPLTGSKLTSTSRPEGLAATIEPGMRAISVQISDSSGAAGLVQPRSHVDVLFTRPGSMSEAVTTTVLENVVVLSVGRATEVSSSTATVDPRVPRPQNQAVTLLVTPEEARKIELAKNQGKVSLALRNPLDRSDDADRQPTTASALNVGQMFEKRPVPNVRDPKVWARLTGESDKPKEEKKDPPKPRLVVDVYRGDKHVQEIFP